MVLKWRVPLDGGWHRVGAGKVVLVDAVDADTAGVWTLEADAEPAVMRSARVYGTGEPVPGVPDHLGSYSWPTSRPLFRWHVFGGWAES